MASFHDGIVVSRNLAAVALQLSEDRKCAKFDDRALKPCVAVSVVG
jgi:hypothetical protein